MFNYFKEHIALRLFGFRDEVGTSLSFWKAEDTVCQYVAKKKKKKRLKDSHVLDLWGIRLLQLVCFNIQQNGAHWRTKWKHMGTEKKKAPCWKFKETKPQTLYSEETVSTTVNHLRRLNSLYMH